MPRSSSASLTAETIQELESQFYEFLNSLEPTDRKKFFAEFLTNEEKMMMYKRLALYWCLLEGYSLAKIQQMIGVTHDTTRVYNKRKNTLSPEFKALVQKIGKNNISEPQSVAPTTDETMSTDHVQDEQPESQPQEVHDEEVTPPTNLETFTETTGEEAEIETQKEVMSETAVIQEDTEKTNEIISEEAKMESLGINLDREGTIETRPLEDTKDEVVLPTDDKFNNIYDDSFRMDPLRSSENEKPTTQLESPTPDFSNDRNEDSINTTQNDGLAPQQKSTDEREDESDDGKKKSGFAKFFGF